MSNELLNSYLDVVGIRKEFFLKLEKKYDKMGQDGGSYSVHKLVDRKGRKAMFYRCSEILNSKKKIVFLSKLQFQIIVHITMNLKHILIV